MNKSTRLFTWFLAFAIAGNGFTPIQAISRNEAAVGAAGIAGIAILTTLLVERTIVPLITGSAQKQAAQRNAARHAHKQEEAREACHEIEQHYTNSTPPQTDSIGLIAHKENLARHTATVNYTLGLFKKEPAEHAKFTALFDILQNRQKNVAEMISEQIAKETCATYEEELEQLKSSKGLDKQTLDRIIVEQHVRAPYRSTTYLDRIEQALANCKQYNAPASVTNLLEILRRRASRLLEPDIVRERKAYEVALREQQEFDVKISGQRAVKDFYNTAQQHVQTAAQQVEEAQRQIAHFSAAMQQQHDKTQETLKSCESHAIRTFQNVADLQTIIALAHERQQKQLEKRIAGTEHAVHQEARQTRETVRTESRDIKRKLDQVEGIADANLGPRPAAQNPDFIEPDPYAPSAPPMD